MLIFNFYLLRSTAIFPLEAEFGSNFLIRISAKNYKKTNELNHSNFELKNGWYSYLAVN